MGGLADLLPRWSQDSAPVPGHRIVRREVRRAAQSLQWPALDQALAGISNADERHYCLELAIEALSGLHQEFSQLGIPVELTGVGVVLLGILLSGDESERAALAPELRDAIDRGLSTAPELYSAPARSFLFWSGEGRRLAPEQLWAHAKSDRDGNLASSRLLSHALAALDAYPALPDGELVSLARHWVRDADDGTDRPLLLLEAHVRHQRRLAVKDEGLGLLYFVEESVQFDIVESIKRSLQSTRYDESPWTERWRSLSAYALYLMGDYRRAREHFGAIGAIPEHAPWCFLGADPQRQFEHAKEIVCRGR